MAVFEIPLRPSNQKLRINLNGINYILYVNWNKFSDCWVLSIHDSNDAPLIDGIPLVTGVDLLGQYKYLGIANGAALYVLTQAVGHAPDEIPTQQNLGTDGHLYLLTH